MAVVTDINRPQPQPPPTACLTAAGATSEVPSIRMHPWGEGRLASRGAQIAMRWGLCGPGGGGRGACPSGRKKEHGPCDGAAVWKRGRMCRADVCLCRCVWGSRAFHCRAAPPPRGPTAAPPPPRGTVDRNPPPRGPTAATPPKRAHCRTPPPPPRRTVDRTPINIPRR